MMRSRVLRAIRARLGIDDLAGRAERTERSLGELRDDLFAAMTAVDQRHLEGGRHLQEEIDRLRSDDARWRSVVATTAWTSQVPLRHEPLISVVLPTRDRRDLVADAVRSVRRQSYQHWELVVVDDGSNDGTAALLDELLADESRASVVRTAGRGAGAARNAGIDAASGAWVAFLDDDNVMDPGWLRAIAEYTGRTPDCVALHGAQLREDVLGGDAVPWLLFQPVPDLDLLKQHNTIDLGMLAVRADHPELRFDESLTLYIDWELVVRIMEHSPIHAVPVISGFYTVRARTRITDQHHDGTLTEMQRRFES